MSNRFFNYLTRFVAGAKVRAEQANARFDELVVGFDDVASELDTLNTAVGATKAAVSLASATTTLISTAASMNVNLTGVATITAFDTMADGTLRYVTAAGAFTLTHHATALILPGAANIVAAAGDSFILKSLGAGNWRVIDYTRASGKAVKGSAVDIPASASGNLAGVNVEQQLQELDVEKAKAAGDATQDFAAKNLSIAGAVNEYKGADIASAATIDLDAATGNLVDVTGTTTITAITLSEGRERTVRFTGILTLTHGASLVMPRAINITTAAGTYAIFRGYAGGVVRCVYCSAAAATSLDYLEYRDEKASGTDGGDATSGSWFTRVLNTESADSGGIGSLLANVVTLPAGTYECEIDVPGVEVGEHQARLYNVTGAAVLLYGATTAATRAGAALGTSHSRITGRFTLAVSTEVRVEHRVAVTMSAHALGNAANFGNVEVYTVARFWKVA